MPIPIVWEGVFEMLAVVLPIATTVQKALTFYLAVVPGELSNAVRVL